MSGSVCEKKKTELKRGDRAITVWKVNTVLGNPLSLSAERERPSEVIYVSSGDGS